MNLIKSIKNLTLTEKIIWISSLITIFVSSIALPDKDWLSVLTSLIGATALIFVGKGDPIGQLICIFFALCYAAVLFRYYGEMITYLGMSAPSALWALISWLRNPYSEREVKVAKMTTRKWMYLSIGTILVTVVMGVILAVFNTPNLIVSIISVTTSFAICFSIFLVNDIYGFINWRRLREKQK